MKIETVAITTLKPHPKNYREHPGDQVKHIGESIKQFGFYKPLVVAEDYTILTGHGVFAAAKSVGLEEIPVHRVDVAPESPQALKILTNDNELGHFAEVDDRILTELLKEIKDEDPLGLLGTGYEDAMLANLLMVTRPASEIADINEAAEWVGMPEFERVELPWKLIVSFEAPELREEFLASNGIEHAKGTESKAASCHWPDKERRDMKSIRFESEAGDVQNPS